MKRKVLVYPCGTEIGLEVYKSLCYSTHYEIWGGSCSYDHGRFVFERHIDNLPFITDKSTPEEVAEFNAIIDKYNFDFIYPVMDGVITVFSKYREYLRPVVVASDYSATRITRSKRLTYETLKDIVKIPAIYSNVYAVSSYPIFLKPDVGQGSKGVQLITSPEQATTIHFRDKNNVVMEYLPGDEYTVDCLTGADGELVYVRARGRRRIKNGISVNAVFDDRDVFKEWAEKINKAIPQVGAWFFQLKENEKKELVLLEVASRIAGSSAITRATGVNLPLLTLNIYSGIPVDGLVINRYQIELDRALSNSYKVDLQFDTVYVDYDDTVIVDKKINVLMMSFLYQCLNEDKKIILISRHVGDVKMELQKYRIAGVFDEVIQLTRADNKVNYINPEGAIFIDDSYGERKAVYDAFQIPVFDTHTIECLIHHN